MKKLTKERIEQMAKEIMDFLIENEISHDVSIYYNNKKMRNNYEWSNGEYVDNVEVLDDYNPHDYFEYAAHNHILSMSFEGSLYTVLNYSFGRTEDEFRKIFEKYGVYYELGNSWNLTAYVIDDAMGVDYTVYEMPREKIYLYSGLKDIPHQLKEIMYKWYLWSSEEGDKGSCVLGAGFNFEWNEDEYFMPAQSPYQGSLSWEAHKEDVQKLLEEIGAINIRYDWGNMD